MWHFDKLGQVAITYFLYSAITLEIQYCPLGNVGNPAYHTVLQFIPASTNFYFRKGQCRFLNLYENEQNLLLVELHCKMHFAWN